MENNNLLKIRYLTEEHFRGGKKECLDTRYLYLNTLKQDLKILNQYKSNLSRINKLTNKAFLTIVELGSKIYPLFSFFLGRKKIWIGPTINKYDFIIKSQQNSNILVLSDIHLSFNSMLKLFLTSNLYYHPIYEHITDLFLGIINDDENLLNHGLNQLKNSLNHMNPDLIILNDDIVPINRAIALVARELGIPTVEIQHGVYISNFIPTGKEVDYLFVWGQHFKDVYVRNKIKAANQIKILGYPYQIKKYDTINNKKLLITYLGQNYEAYDESLLSNKLETLINIGSICDKLNFDFIYRPHPGDDLNFLKSKLKNVKFTHPGETLQETFKKGDIFISFDSTALVEASLHSKLSIQLKSYDMPTDNFENWGACSKSVNNFEELEAYLKKIKYGNLSSFYRPVKENYIEIPSSNPETRFLELIQDII